MDVVLYRWCEALYSGMSRLYSLWSNKLCYRSIIIGGLLDYGFKYKDYAVSRKC